MSNSIFIRLLSSPVDSKGDDLIREISAINHKGATSNIFLVDPHDFFVIPGFPFAYWARAIITVFSTFSALEPKFGIVIRGPEVINLERTLRLWFEVPSDSIGLTKKWVHYAKGGAYKPYSSDIHLFIDYSLDRDNIEPFRRPGNPDNYFKPGVTFTQRTSSQLSFRVLNSGCLTSPKGPGIIPSQNKWCNYLLALGNSAIFQKLVELRVGAADSAARSYDLDIIRKTPVPKPNTDELCSISRVIEKILHISTIVDSFTETSYSYILPIIVDTEFSSSIKLTLETMAVSKKKIGDYKKLIDENVSILYGISAVGINELIDNTINAERLESNNDDNFPETVIDSSDVDEVVDEEINNSPKEIISSLLSWCIGVAFGRWDVRRALDPTYLPPLPGQFDPLPICSPGMLQGVDGLHLAPSALTADYPLKIAVDGVLVDDPAHPRDMLAAVRNVLRLVWGDRVNAIEPEICQILAVPDLRAWFRDPKGFFAYHIKRYSKSRRKAPIYWLLQSPQRSYAIWLYYPRLNPDSLFHAAREYGDAKLQLEKDRLNEMSTTLEGVAGTSLKTREKQIARQTDLAAEIGTFQKKLDEAAALELNPDLNDGVLLNIAPLHALVPWKEAEKTWKELLSGAYEWSTIHQQLSKKGFSWASSPRR